MMRGYLVSLALVAVGAGCTSSAATNLLCTYCTDDSQCGGNPCFMDTSGGRFCGSPCDNGCPTGYTCQPVTGTSPGVVQTCFPNTEQCKPMGPAPGVDLAGPASSTDMALPPGSDLSSSGPRDMGSVPIPVGGPVTAAGGTVDRLFFGFTGDTRPDQCDSTYPTAVISNIYTQMKGQGVQFAVDQGDHMFNCQGGFSGATKQMNAYLTAASLLGKTVFMTMGNHECTGERNALCSLASYGNNTNYTVFVDALKKTGINQPYYRFDVMTNAGLAVFIVVADDAWDTTQEQWLNTQLTDADAHAKYTFVSKHHPDGNSDWPVFQTIYNDVVRHKYTLFLTGHTHEFKQQWSDPRSLVIGCGGAPFNNPGSGYWGYGTALQGPDGRIYVTIYDQATGNATQKFDVAPQ